jgi:hypothetical protein
VLLQVQQQHPRLQLQPVMLHRQGDTGRKDQVQVALPGRQQRMVRLGWSQGCCVVLCAGRLFHSVAQQQVQHRLLQLLLQVQGAVQGAVQGGWACMCGEVGPLTQALRRRAVREGRGDQVRAHLWQRVLVGVRIMQYLEH